ncbi:MAG: GatB/YqeY domain-containing protein [Patescibacteria group bacterium]
MSLAERLRGDLKSAMQTHDKQRLSTLRMLSAAIKNKEIEERKKDIGLGDEEVLLVISREAKKRKDSIAEFEKAGRAELAAAEAEELAILTEYLPTELPDEEVKRIVADGVREIGGADPKKFGDLMKVIMPLLKNRASGDRVTKFAKEALNG